MSEEEQEAIEYFEHKIKNKLPLYEETYVDGKPYRRNFLQLETNFTEEQANKTQIILNLIDRLQKELEKKDKVINNAKDTIDYYLLGNMSLDDFNKREKELNKLKKTLEVEEGE